MPRWLRIGYFYGKLPEDSKYGVRGNETGLRTVDAVEFVETFDERFLAPDKRSRNRKSGVPVLQASGLPTLGSRF